MLATAQSALYAEAPLCSIFPSISYLAARPAFGAHHELHLQRVDDAIDPIWRRKSWPRMSA